MRTSHLLVIFACIAVAFTGVVTADTGATFSEAEEAKLQQSSESFQFQAEVNRLMDIIINSLYKVKDIFLRELISNASDALDKIRYLALLNSAELGEHKDLKIELRGDKEAHTLTIRDTGVGMTKQDLIQNLGTVAKSGTTNFVESLSQSGDLSLIGQFGVGFYSVYLVADRVRVVSKNNNDDQYVWESTADGRFTVAKDPRGNTLGRGTEITLFLKEDAEEFADSTKLEELVKRYSQFITFPIYVWSEQRREVEADEYEDDLDAAADEDEAATEDEDYVIPTDETDTDVEAPKTKVETFWDWKRTNAAVAIWAREKEDVTDEEYQSFYKTISGDSGEAGTWIHFKAEGEVEFKSILYIPKFAPVDLYDHFYDKKANLKLYVRKVLITDEFDEMVPGYLNFIRGVVDSDDLPLNVSRETLQQHKLLKIMGKKLTRKILEMLKTFAAESEEKVSKGEVEDGEDGYSTFWEQFGKSIKLGVIEDEGNRSKLAKLVRFKTNKSENKWSSLDAYITRMKSWQKGIYYIAGESVELLEKSPFLEKIRKKDLEVLFLTEPLDEYTVQQIAEYENFKLQSVTKEGLKFGDEDENVERNRERFYKEKYQPLTEYLKKLLGNKVSKVAISSRVENTPLIVVTAQWGHSANMERIMRAQALADPSRANMMSASKTLELNPRHPLIDALNERVKKNPTDSKLEDISLLLVETAWVNSGFVLDELDVYSQRMYRSLQGNLGLGSLSLLDEPTDDELASFAPPKPNDDLDLEHEEL